jgi:RecA/RadA recombinase
MVRAVPTRFIQYDHGTKVGGHPTERIALLHGPSGEGKTYFTLGQMGSFLERENPVLFVDAERTTTEGFAKLAIAELVKSPIFFYEKPTTYEEVVVRVRKWCNFVKRFRDEGKLGPDACGLIVIDSIRKMVPQDQWNRILELEKAERGGKKKPEKLRDRSAQIKALMNSAWCDELIPLLEQTGCTMIIIARETADPDADQMSKKFGTDYVTGGGGALYYDASLDIRVERQRYVVKDMGEGQKPIVYGERHKITIKKSKIAGKEDKTIVCYFHTSNGSLVPAGFDRARDVLELARRFEIVKAAVPKVAKGAPKKKAAGGGGWLSWNGQRWQGEHAAVKKLSESPDLLAELTLATRAKFALVQPTEVAS